MNNINVNYDLLEYFRAQSMDHNLCWEHIGKKPGVFTSLILYEGQMQLATSKTEK